MRLSTSTGSTSVGNVEIHDTFRVIELDAGFAVKTNRFDTHPKTDASSSSSRGLSTVAFSHKAIHSVESELAIVVPCKNEDVSILDGVLHGIPHECLIILVSNSDGYKYDAECALLTLYCTNAQRSGIVAHQHDAGIAQAFIDAGMPEIVAENSQPPRIRNGKGEAMIMGVALAKLAGKQYVGFVDADNLVAGSVHEYCKVYAAGLHYALNCADSDSDSDSDFKPHAMVRIKWNSKPKVRDGEIVFEKSGRSSRVVNEWMNRLLNSLVRGDEQDKTIQTANAGEHALSLDLAMGLKFATGYAVEPFQLIDAWERMGSNDDFGALLSPEMDLSEFPTYTAEVDHSAYSSADDSTPAGSASTSSYSTPVSSRSSSRPPSRLQAATDRTVRILQIETRNPHFHDTGKGVDHISKMQAEGLSAIFHSRLIPDKLKDELRQYVKANLSDVPGVAADGTPKAPRVYPPVGTMDFSVFESKVRASATTMKVVGVEEDVL
jgi:mannosyl-3-phosphoglycerate synthase